MLLLLLACTHTGKTPPEPTVPPSPILLVPAPRVLEPGDGRYRLDASSTFSSNAPAPQILAELQADTGLPFSSADTGDVRLMISDDVTAPEGYLLDVDASGVTLTAADADGLYWGVQTLRQLLPSSGKSELPYVHIEDAPRYPQRGLMIDVARHFFTVEQIERQVDAMALHKLNRLHMHLTDDQGWRIEILSWPDLTAIGGATEVGGGPGGYYTQEEFRSLVDYAAARHIVVVPEVDFPGHANAALASYAELNESGERAEVYTGEGVISTPLWLEGPATAGFVADVWREVSALSPTAEVHIGGDEAVDISEESYAIFLRDLQKVVEENGATLTGWDEIGGQGLTAPYTAQWWWHADGAAAAAAEGATILSSPAEHAYFDMMYDRYGQFGQVWAGRISLQESWDWDPTPPGVDPSSVIGVEAALWTEMIDTTEQMDFMLWPRSAALAEVGWSEAGGDWEDFAPRVAADGPRLEALGLAYYPTPEVEWE